MREVWLITAVLVCCCSQAFCEDGLTFLGSCYLPWDFANSCVSDGEYLYIGTENGLEVVDISNLDNPAHVTFIPTDERINDLAVYGDYLYCAWQENYINIYQIDDPDSIRLVAQERTEGPCRQIYLFENYAVCSIQYNGFLIYDLDNPVNLNPIFESDEYRTVNGFFIKDDLLYVAAAQDGLVIYDLNEEEQIGIYDTPGVARRVSLLGDYAYVTDYAAGVRVVDISEPEDPRYAGRMSTGPVALDFFFRNGIGYLFLASDEIARIEFHDDDPTYPVITDRYYLESTVTDYSVKDNILIVTTGNRGCEYFEFDEYHDLSQIGKMFPTGIVKEFKIFDHSMLVAASYGGVKLFNIDKDYGLDLVDTQVMDSPVLLVEPGEGYLHSTTEDSTLYSFILNRNDELEHFATNSLDYRASYIWDLDGYLLLHFWNLPWYMYDIHDPEELLFIMRFNQGLPFLDITGNLVATGNEEGLNLYTIDGHGDWNNIYVNDDYSASHINFYNELLYTYNRNDTSFILYDYSEPEELTPVDTLRDANFARYPHLNDGFVFSQYTGKVLDLHYPDNNKVVATLPDDLYYRNFDFNPPYIAAKASPPGDKNRIDVYRIDNAIHPQVIPSKTFYRISDTDSLLINVTAYAHNNRSYNIDLHCNNLHRGMHFIDHGDNTAIFSWITSANEADTIFLDFEARDSEEAFDDSVYVKTTKVYILDVDHPPEWRMLPEDTISGYVGTEIDFDVIAIDLDHDSLWYTWDIDTLPRRAIFRDLGGGMGYFRWTPTENDTGIFQIEFSVNSEHKTVSRTCNLSILSSREVDSPEEVPLNFSLDNIHPNPFNQNASLSFSLPTAGMVLISMYDLNGRLVKDLGTLAFNSGVNKISITTAELPTGSYILRVKHHDEDHFRRFTLIR
ncbi:T9SS type A sorting domain-containing protein [Calditrichota bacterium]